MSQFDNPYSYQANNIFNMGIPDWKKKRLMESPITAAQAQRGVGPFMQVNEVQGTRFGSVNPHGNMGVSTVYAPAQANPSVPYGFSGSPIQGGGVVPKAVGIAPTPGTVGGSDAPKRDLDFTSYSKSLDKSFMMAALQSAIPEDQPAPSGISGGGAHGGGENLGSMQEYASAERRKKKNPALWRYSANV
jgi:hypothetical protein